MLSRLLNPPPSDKVHPEIARHFRRNFLFNAGDMTAWMFGMSFISLQAILPVYAARLTSSPLIIGLIPALTDALWFLPQLFLAPWVERLPRKQPAVVLLGLVERLPYFLLPLMVLWMEGLPRSGAVAVFVVWLFVKSLTGGIIAIPWQEMVAKVTPITHRGRLFGLGHVVGQLLGVGGSALATWLLARLPYPHNFAACFAAAALSVGVSQLMLLQIREPAMPPALSERPSWGQYARRLWVILAGDANLRIFLVSRWLHFLGTMAFGFLAVYAVQRFGLRDSAAAVFTGILYGAGVAGYAVWGWVGDRVGHKRVLVIGGGLWLAALTTTLLAFDVAGFYLAFALMGLSSSAGVLGDISLTMELGPEAERPTYIGLTRTFTGPALLIAPLAGGWIAQTWGYPVLFGTSLLFAALGLGVLVFLVREPRHLQRGL